VVLKNQSRMPIKDKHILSDAELLERYRQDAGGHWLGTLFERYRHLVFGLCMKYLKDREDAKDATNAIFEKLISTMLIQEVKTFEHWIYTVSRNHCLMKLRTDQRQRVHISKMKIEGNDEEELSSVELREMNLNQLESAINGLSKAQKECVLKFYIEEKSYKEVSEETGFSLLEVKSHLQNGKRNLKIILSKTA
jgi:RNA polymerase sigma factor (sigma-70 family)